MIILDKLLVSGVKFVLDKVAQAADAELNDETHLREALLDAQMRAELGEITDAELAEIEADILPRLRAAREAQGAISTGDSANLDADVEYDAGDDEDAKR